MGALEQVPLDEAVQLGAVDGSFFGSYFFPRAFRQEPPAFHREMDEALDDPGARYLSFMLFRGAAKTTKVRVFIARRIAYAMSRTIMVVGKNQDHAIKTLEWVKKAVEQNSRWAGTFGLRKGARWSGADIEIVHTQFKDENGGPLTIRLLAYGMTGSVRGLNIDDYRPDLILVDDPDDEETTATVEQRKKTRDLFFGSLQKSLAPRSESPHAKMILLQTLLNSYDLVSECERNPQWRSLRYGCFDEHGQSRWPTRHPTKELLADKQNHIDRGMLSLWMREMECRLVADELAAFKEEDLRFWDKVDENGIGGVVPPGGITFLSIDPTPPPKNTEKEKARITSGLDTAVICVKRIVNGNVYLCDFAGMKSPDPDHFINQIFLMARLWGARTVVIETILFQRVLRWLREKAMQARREYLTIIPIEDPRAKPLRIQQEIKPYASQGKLYCSSEHMEFIDQYVNFPNIEHDDYVDAVSIGLMHVNPWMLEMSAIDGEFERLYEDDGKALPDWRPNT